jgi:hypothetical protein
VEKHRRHFLAAFFSVLAVFLVGVYLFVSFNAETASAQMPSMMPSVFPTSTPTGPLSDQALLSVLVAIVIVVVALVAILVYIASQRRSAAKGTPHTYTSRSVQTTTTPSQGVTEFSGKPLEVFLCYKKSSGKDYADHLKSGLEEVGLHTFEDCKDIPLTVTTEEGWAKIRDQALAESKYFVLIMTHGFDLSSEVVKEIKMARKQANKTFVFFRHRSMGRKIVVNLGDEVFDISGLEQVSFESKEELLRLAINILKSEKP